MITIHRWTFPVGDYSQAEALWGLMSQDDARETVDPSFHTFQGLLELVDAVRSECVGAMYGFYREDELGGVCFAQIPPGPQTAAFVHIVARRHCPFVEEGAGLCEEWLLNDYLFIRELIATPLATNTPAILLAGKLGYSEVGRGERVTLSKKV